MRRQGSSYRPLYQHVGYRRRRRQPLTNGVVVNSIVAFGEGRRGDAGILDNALVVTKDRTRDGDAKHP